MELTAEQQAEYDVLFKELVAQGGPKVGKLKAAGNKDPDGVARLIELGWVNPDAVATHRTIVNIATGKETDVRDYSGLTKETDKAPVGPEESELEADRKETDESKMAGHIKIVAEGHAKEQEELIASEVDSDGFVPDELKAAQKEAEKAQIEADEAIRKAEEKAADVVDKTPPPCTRCNGDGFWHSLKTGYRAKTSSEPLIDTSRTCPECN